MNTVIRTASLQDLVDHPGLNIFGLLSRRLLEKTDLARLYLAEENLRRYGKNFDGR